MITLKTKHECRERINNGEYSAATGKMQIKKMKGPQRGLMGVGG